MRLFGPEYLRQKAAEGYWQDLYDRWSTTIHMVVWLDAANEVLLDRIRTRRQDHIMKAQPVPAVYEFLNRYRDEYVLILSVLTARQAGIKVLRFDTGRQQPQEIVNRFLSELSC
jgi:hypothetical protein